VHAVPFRDRVVRAVAGRRQAGVHGARVLVVAVGGDLAAAPEGRADALAARARIGRGARLAVAAHGAVRLLLGHARGGLLAAGPRVALVVERGAAPRLAGARLVLALVVHRAELAVAARRRVRDVLAAGRRLAR